MNHISRWLISAAITAGITLPVTSHATNGMFLIGFGSKSQSMGGTAIANPQDSLAGAANPAAISQFNIRADVSADFFVPLAEACTTITSTGATTCEKSKANRFLIPAMGGAYKFNRKLWFGFSAVGAGGGGSRYNRNLFNLNNVNPSDDKNTLGVNMMVMQMNPTISYRVKKNHYVGASPIISVQTFRAFGLQEFTTFQNFTGSAPPNSNLGNDWAYGAGLRVGYLGKFLKKKLILGAAASSEVYMTEFDKYKNLIPEQGQLNTPPQFGVGMSYKLNDKWTVAADITHTLYSEVNAISNQGPCVPQDAACNNTAFPVSKVVNGLGEDEGLGFGWDDQTVYKLGVAYDHNSHWSFRAGWNYGESPINETEGDILFNTVAPAVTQHHMTLGFSYRPSSNIEWSMHYVRAFNYKQSGPTFINERGSIEMNQHALGGSFSFSL